MMYRKNYAGSSFLKHGIFFLVFIIPLLASGQKGNAKSAMDTIKLKKGSTITFDKKKVFVKNDSIILLPHNTKYSLQLSREEQFYQNLKDRATSKFWTRELHNIIIAPSSAAGKSDTFKTIPGIFPFIPFQDRYIRSIIVHQLPVFGPTINDTSRKAKSFLERAGNRLHFQTKKYLITSNLIFKTGDLLDPSDLADNERILRSLPYIEDAKIEVVSVNNSDSVDVLVIVKDVWSKAFNLKINDIYSGRIELWDKNIFGLGHENQSSILWDSREDPSVGYEGLYKVNNISGTFINGTLKYYNSFRTQIKGINFERSFFTPNIKYAGGLKFENTATRVIYKDTASELTPVRFNHLETWVGRSILLSKKRNFSKARHNLTFVFKVKKDYFYNRPEITEDSYYTLQNKTLYLFSTSYTQQQFYKSNLIYNFGRTEDIPVGGEIGFTIGREYNEFALRNYAECRSSFGKFLDGLGYLHSSIQLGSFYNKGKPEQGILQANINYFSKLLTFKTLNFRQFINFNYTSGFERFKNEHLILSEPYGLTGLKNDSVYGSKRLNMNWETVCFTPWTFFEFKFVIFLFGNHSWINYNKDKLMDWNPYTGFGIGVRLRNERLVFNTVQIKFTIFPHFPSLSEVKRFDISGEPVLTPPNFIPKSPDIKELR